MEVGIEVKIVFFDDNPILLENYKNLMQRYDYVENAHFYQNSKSVKRHVNTEKEPSLYFLDLMENNINMGFTLLHYILSVSPESAVVFVTAYPELISYNSSYKLKIQNWILKTSQFFEEEIIISIEHTIQYLGKTTLTYNLGFGDYHRIPIEQIVFVEILTRQNKLMIHVKNGSFVVRDNLLSFEKKVEKYPFLYRCHNSFLANIREISTINKTEKQITFFDGRVCFYSKFRAKELYARWELHG